MTSPLWQLGNEQDCSTANDPWLVICQKSYIMANSADIWVVHSFVVNTKILAKLQNHSYSYACSEEIRKSKRSAIKTKDIILNEDEQQFLLIKWKTLRPFGAAVIMQLNDLVH